MTNPLDAPPPPPVDRAAVAAKVKPPAIALIVLGALTIVSAGINLAMGPEGMRPMLEQVLKMQGEELDRALQSARAGGIVMGILLLGGAVLTLIAGIKMAKLQSWGLAVAGASVALVNCPNFCCCLGLPIGIWALLVLMKPDVKAAMGAAS